MPVSTPNTARGTIFPINISTFPGGLASRFKIQEGQKPTREMCKVSCKSSLFTFLGNQAVTRMAEHSQMRSTNDEPCG